MATVNIRNSCKTEVDANEDRGICRRYAAGICESE